VAPAQAGVMARKAKALKVDWPTASPVRKFQSKVKVAPAGAKKVCLKAEPSWTEPLPSPVKLPGVRPRKFSRVGVVGEPRLLWARASKLPSVGPVPKAAVLMLVLPRVCHSGAKVPVSE